MPEGVVSDVIGCFTVYKSSKDYPEELRKLVVEDPEDGTRYIFLTNNLDASAELISSLYRNRWSVELFFYDKHFIMQSNTITSFANPLIV